MGPSMSDCSLWQKSMLSVLVYERMHFVIKNNANGAQYVRLYFVAKKYAMGPSMRMNFVMKNNAKGPTM